MIKKYGESQQTQRFLLLFLFNVLLFGFRYFKTGDPLGFGLLWNLFLAGVPVFFALLAARTLRFNRYAGIGSAFLWLLFYPNSAYIITDLVHLDHLPRHLWWYDSLGIFFAAFTGLALGLYSLWVIHHRVLELLLPKVLIWPSVGICLALSGYGIYLGRFLRFNSWDILSSPVSLAVHSVSSLANPLAIRFTLVFAVSQFVLYLFFLLQKQNSYESVKDA